MPGRIFEVKYIPAKTLKLDPVRLELLNALRSEGRAIKKMQEKTVSTWRRKPKFKFKITLTGKRAGVVSGTGSKIYKFVDEGTDRHIIRPRRAPRLKFQTGYTAKTRPGIIGSRTGGPKGPVVRAMLVNHPGTKAREFSKTIKIRRRRPFSNKIQDAIDKGMKKAF